MESQIFTFKHIDKDEYLSSHMGVYQISNASGKYVGSTGRSFKKRLQDHKTCLRNNKHHSQRLQNTFNKYGEESFSISILEEITDADLLIEREQYWIDLLQPAFNSRPFAASNRGHKHTEEQKRVNRAASRKRTDHPNTSGHIGVSWDKSRQMWETTISIRVQRSLHLGYFDSVEEAGQMREKAEAYFWYGVFDSRSEEDQIKALNLFKEERFLTNNRIYYQNKTGEQRIAFSKTRNMYTFTLNSEPICRTKTLEEAVSIRDEYIQKLLTIIRDNPDYIPW